MRKFHSKRLKFAIIIPIILVILGIIGWMISSIDELKYENNTDIPLVKYWFSIVFMELEILGTLCFSLVIIYVILKKVFKKKDAK